MDGVTRSGIEVVDVSHLFEIEADKATGECGWSGGNWMFHVFVRGLWVSALPKLKLSRLGRLSMREGSYTKAR